MPSRSQKEFENRNETWTRKRQPKGVLIELLFKQIKQNFPLRYFWGESPNAIKMQVYCVLIAQLLMVVIRKKAVTKKSFANMITVIRLHLTSYVGLLDFIKDTYKAWRKTDNAPFAFSP